MKRKWLWLLPIVCLSLIACSKQTNDQTAATSTEESSVVETKVSEETTIYLVRHGKTWFNTMNQVQGFSDSPLTELGETQAQAVGNGLKDIPFVAAFSSDLGRQRNTAKLILAENANGIPEITELLGFREKNFGSFEGQSNDAMNIAVAESLNLDYPEGSDELWDFLKQELTEEELANKVAEVDPSQTAETYEEMKSRVEKAMPEMLKIAEEAGGGNVLIVSSGGLIPIILESVAPGSYNGEKIGNCSVTTLKVKDGIYTIESIGDTTFADTVQD
ncbi:broad specificity phosphatase PhoE [Enterococcus sp. PF1-24]|uniref:histidine phosphatase family protein n=1 Tax=unclassified Enterococcus TaxID=2608891 RepID=UPI00247729F7|nr:MULTISPECIES: histidine phosphatase family protein [unclassified Enterococcus]MDH6365426.1 broad specificity phosphatase PhoE [Enterococcus sp. PFB1-1]MDH6402502.1 broad specificity phosphatase PhoE [Enterococcus sp. PF1-24]